MTQETLPMVRLLGSRPFPPRVSAFTRPFWLALERGIMTAPRCRNCNRLRFPPRPVCPACWSPDYEWAALRPRGKLYSFTRVHVAPRSFAEEGPYAVGIIDLDDGIRLLCRIWGEVAFQSMAKNVEIVVLQYDNGPLFAARMI
ncbi:MAG: Zn-ribbon domain-containing OB-fold protein [Bradyrhizobium sp.]